MTETASPAEPGAVVVTAVDDPSAPEIVALADELTAELLDRYGRGDGGASFRPEQARGRGVFVVARRGASLLGCGALVPTDTWPTGEIKRMYVRPAARRRGVARRILRELEAAAVRHGYATLRLETGPLQPEALALYGSVGFGPVAAWPPFDDDPDSVCLAKSLGPNPD